MKYLLADHTLMGRSKFGDRGTYAELFARHADRSGISRISFSTIAEGRTEAFIGFRY